MFRMRRRDFVTLLGGVAAAWPVVARAQQGERVRHVVVWIGGSGNDPTSQQRGATFRDAMRGLGWTEGRNVKIDVRFPTTNAAEETRAAAAELAALNPDVIVTTGAPILGALHRVTKTVPIVFTLVTDPVTDGFVASLARPGGNLTGLLLYKDGITGKWLAMLKEIAPRIERAALVANPKTTNYDYFLRSAKAVASSLAIELVPSPIENAADLERVIESFARVANGGLVVLPDNTAITHRDLVIALAVRHRLPAVYNARLFVAAGGLMSYGTNLVDTFRQAASYVDSILRGAKPADLPVQAPTKYETTLNLKTAKALDLDVPPTLLVRADEVIE